MTALGMVDSEDQVGRGHGIETDLRSLSQQSSAVDYDAAQQLVQHAQEGRLKRTAEAANLSGYSNGAGYYHLVNAQQNKAPGSEYGLPHLERASSRRVSPESVTDNQYSPSHNTPTMGQVCR